MSHPARRRRVATPTPGESASACETSVNATLETLYRSEHAKLICYLGARVGYDAASDIAQEVFVRVAASPQLLHLVNPGGYLCRIAQNIVIDRARAQRRKVAATWEPSEVPLTVHQGQEFAAIDWRLTLDRMVSNLPARTRQVFLMYCTEDMAYRDIHRALGISIGAVEYHMSRAVAHLRGAAQTAI